MTIQEQRRRAFEELYYDLNYMGIPSRNTVFRRKTMGDYYYKAPREAWFWFNAALDSVEVELPAKLEAQPYACYEGGWNDALLEAADAIEAAGVRVKG